MNYKFTVSIADGDNITVDTYYVKNEDSPEAATAELMSHPHWNDDTFTIDSVEETDWTDEGAVLENGVD